MTVPILERHEFDQLRGLIEGWCGISLEDTKLYLVESRLRDVVMETGCASYGEFYKKARGAGGDLRDRIIDQIFSIAPDGSGDTQLTTAGRNANPAWR